MASYSPDASYAPDTRWSWVEIDQGALRYNTRAWRNCIAPRKKMMCVVKADAYGHGAATCAKIMANAGADQFAVATVLEGVALRKAGITKPILVLSEPPATAIPALLEYNIMPSVYTKDFALALGEQASLAHRVASYHLVVDTGMNRIGLQPQDVLEFRQMIDFHRGLECAGIFTHFATADELQGWDFDLQYSRFMNAVSALEDAGLEHGLVHCNNTPATILHPATQHDMCRVGIGLYGLHAAQTTMPYIDLRPVMSVHARVTRTHIPAVGDGVSYGFTYRVPKQNIQIATIPVGYADGLSRVLSNKMQVIAAGQLCQQVGRICMDQCMFAVDLTSRSYNQQRPVAIGDHVILMGSDDNYSITADDIAALRNTINYEVTCNFGMRLEKVYV
ncbi:alanine racemase [Atopobium deltae]|uniref:Alanine racemase n=1 Tax=Atopobium deltae TaxID=1393034 RepID=A0A133XVN4_9ACTN|nr:alanine racemase [Atopobium deltae]KXB35008.1 alanine racemase [Atopobium deltae]